MPYVDGLSSFIDKINKLVGKTEFIKSNGFRVEALVSEDNKLEEFTVIPKKYNSYVNQASDLLQFDNQSDDKGKSVLKIGRSGNQKKYIVLNERALMNPIFSNFKKKYRYRGAVH